MKNSRENPHKTLVIALCAIAAMTTVLLSGCTIEQGQDIIGQWFQPAATAPFVTPDSKPYALILEDATKAVPEPQATWLMEFQLAFREKGEVRRLHYQSPELLDEPWKSAFDKVAPHATTLPYVAISRNGSGWEGTQPATRDELLSKVEKYTK